MKRLLTLTLLLGLSLSVSHAQLGGKKSPPKADERVRKALNEAGQKFEVDSDGDFKLVMKVGDSDRTQVIFVNSSTESYESFEIREIWSVGLRTPTSFSGSIANALLKDNFRKKLGAWQVQRINSQDTAVFCAKVAADMSGAELLNILTAVVKSADAMEKEQNGGRDDY